MTESAIDFDSLENLSLSIDRTYHKEYDISRKKIHLNIVNTILQCHSNKMTSLSQRNCRRHIQTFPPVLIFTAGPMGVGKSTFVQWLQKESYLAKGIVVVDIDEIRKHLPESSQFRGTVEYGERTQSEAGYIAELCVHAALYGGKSVVVDGSMTNISWQLEYIAQLRRSRPELKVVLLHVTATESTIRNRLNQRATNGGRIIPHHLVDGSLQLAELSRFDRLRPAVHHFVGVNVNGAEPCLVHPWHMTWTKLRDIMAPSQPLCLDDSSVAKSCNTRAVRDFTVLPRLKFEADASFETAVSFKQRTYSRTTIGHTALNGSTKQKHMYDRTQSPSDPWFTLLGHNSRSTSKSMEETDSYSQPFTFGTDIRNRLAESNSVSSDFTCEIAIATEERTVSRHTQTDAPSSDTAVRDSTEIWSRIENMTLDSSSSSCAQFLLFHSQDTTTAAGSRWPMEQEQEDSEEECCLFTDESAATTLDSCGTDDTIEHLDEAREGLCVCAVDPLRWHFSHKYCGLCGGLVDACDSDQSRENDQSLESVAAFLHSVDCNIEQLRQELACDAQIMRLSAVRCGDIPIQSSPGRSNLIMSCPEFASLATIRQHTECMLRDGSDNGDSSRVTHHRHKQHNLSLQGIRQRAQSCFSCVLDGIKTCKSHCQNTT